MRFAYALWSTGNVQRTDNVNIKFRLKLSIKFISESIKLTYLCYMIIKNLLNDW